MLYALTILLGAFLLFLVQPIIVKQILPWFGGSAAVWSTALAFFQVTLLAGYAYADWSVRRLKPRFQVCLHLVLLAAGLAALPIIPDASWKPLGGEDPGIRIAGLLAASIGLPFFLLSSTGPMLQAWFARAFPARRVYRLYALSNLASLLALGAYPFLVEPSLRLIRQAEIWSAGFGLFVLASAAVAIHNLRQGSTATATATTAEDGKTPPPPTALQMLGWLLLAALASWMLLAATNQITRNMASIPFLWLLPLALYLLTFILCFGSDRGYPRRIILGLLAAALVSNAWGLQADIVLYHIKLAIPLYSAGLFVSCMFLHGELAASRPSPVHLTRFYLMLSLGGALGGLFVGLIAPHVFNAYYELGIGLVLVALAAAWVLRHESGLHAFAAAVVAVISSVYFGQQVLHTVGEARQAKRNFYGTLATYDEVYHVDLPTVRTLVDGGVVHGEQYQSGPLRDAPIGYYGPNSGIGRLMQLKNPEPLKVGVIGLGAGTMAAFGKEADVYHFYEINPQVIELAEREFSYLRVSPAAIRVSLGDGRMSLEREEAQGFDVLLVDAFSSDSVPVHLMTREAMIVYLRHLEEGGVIIFNVTNRNLNLAPIVHRLAADLDLYSSYISDTPGTRAYRSTEFVLVAKDRLNLSDPLIADGTTKIHAVPGVALWTDDFSNLFQILR